MDLTVAVLGLVVRVLQDESEKHPLGEYASDAFIDAADALADVIDLLTDLGD